MALTVGVQTANAEGDPASFSLDYIAPQACPARAQFIEAIVSRTPTAHEVARAHADIAFTARIIAAGPATTGELWVEPSSGASSRREVGPASCPEIIESMAVIAALILAGGEPASPADSTAAGAPPISEPSAAPTPPLEPARVAPVAPPLFRRWPTGVLLPSRIRSQGSPKLRRPRPPPKSLCQNQSQRARRNFALGCRSTGV